MARWSGKLGYGVLSLAILPVTAFVGRSVVTSPRRTPVWPGRTAADTIAHGRYLVISHGCGGCHGGGTDPAADGWLAGETEPDMQFLIGPCYLTPGAKPCFHTHPRNLTPDNQTGLGRFTEHQIFNALRFGLRPEETPDMVSKERHPACRIALQSRG